MLQISVARLYEENREKLGLAWVGGQRGAGTLVRRDVADAPALVGHLNLIHANRIQVLGTLETRHLAAFDDSALLRPRARIFLGRL